jgi:transcriptional regulator NrdR family protein
MKCPKCKKGKLGTARTFGMDERVRREKVCQAPKCGHRFWSVEISEAALEALNAELHSAKHQKDLNTYGLEQRVRELEGAALVMFEAAEKAKKARR